MGICICCCCNKKNTDCLENTLIVFTSIEIIFLLLGLILIDWKIAAYVNLVLNIFIFLILVFNLTALILFKCFREYGTIYTKYKKLCQIFAYLGMSFSILCIFLSILSESLISEKIYKYDHPCLNKLSSETSMNNDGSPTDGIIDNEKLIKQTCDGFQNQIFYVFWYNKRSSPKDIIMSYICSSIIEILSLIGAFIWYNETRRIKYCIKNRMTEEKGLIKYGVFGDYLGNNSNEKNIIIENEEITYTRGNMNVNMNFNNNIKKEEDHHVNISSVINSSLSNEKKVVKNELTNLQNDGIIKESEAESNISEDKEEKIQKEASLYSADFY